MAVTGKVIGEVLRGKADIPRVVHGKNGESAYEIAVKNGFDGTEEEWLSSLKGEKGDQGEKGERGDTDNIREVVEVFLDSGYWENNKQTIPCSSVGENSAVFPNPTAESKNDYIIAGIELTEATAESLTFTCSYVPTNDIDVLVYITDPVIVVDGNGVPEITEKDANKVLTANEDGTAEWKDPTGGATSWNDLEDRPFYEETVIGEVVIEYDGDPTGKVVVSMGEEGQLVKVSDLTPEPSELIGGTANVGGQSLTITTDAIEDARPAGMPGASVGGGMLMIVYEPIPSYGITEAGMYIVDMGVPGTLTYTGTVTNIKKLDMKYLEFSQKSEIANETIDATRDSVGFANDFNLVAGETYIVDFDGTQYTCVAQLLEGFVFIGNLHIAGALEDSGEPFIIVKRDDGCWMTTLIYGVYHIKIYHVVEYAKIPKECLPDDIGSSGLPEVTAEDNGKFLQVVDGAYALVALQDVSKEGA